MKKQYTALGTVIKNQLNLLEKNQSWLAMKCGITEGQISHIMTGRSKPSFKVMRSISDAIGIDFGSLIMAALETY